MTSSYPARLGAAALCAALIAVCQHASAQSPTTQMPEGTTDVDLSLIAAMVPVSEGQGNMRAIVIPSISAQWSNGIFAEPGEVGMQLSEDPMLKFGPLLSYGARTRRADEKDHKSSLGIEAGGFASYRLAHNIGFSAQLLYGGSDDHRGVRLNVGANSGLRIGSHQSLSASVGMSVVDRAYMQSYFGVTAAQAARGRRPVYQAEAGIKNVYVSLGWQLELSTKYSLNTGVNVSRLVGSAADSPLVKSPNNGALFSVLTYHW